MDDGAGFGVVGPWREVEPLIDGPRGVRDVAEVRTVAISLPVDPRLAPTPQHSAYPTRAPSRRPPVAAHPMLVQQYRHDATQHPRHALLFPLRPPCDLGSLKPRPTARPGRNPNGLPAHPSHATSLLALLAQSP